MLNGGEGDSQESVYARCPSLFFRGENVKNEKRTNTKGSLFHSITPLPPRVPRKEKESMVKGSRLGQASIPLPSHQTGKCQYRLLSIPPLRPSNVLWVHSLTALPGAKRDGMTGECGSMKIFFAVL